MTKLPQMTERQGVGGDWPNPSANSLLRGPKLAAESRVLPSPVPE